MLLDCRNCTALHKRRTLKATNPHCLSLGGVVATAPALRKHNQDQSSKETVKTISLELDRVERGVWAWCGIVFCVVQQDVKGPSWTAEVQKLRGGCKMLQVCLVGSLSLSLVPLFGKSFKQKVPTAPLLHAVLYTTKRMEPFWDQTQISPWPICSLASCQTILFGHGVAKMSAMGFKHLKMLWQPGQPQLDVYV